jgi:hypothetical protein
LIKSGDAAVKVYEENNKVAMTAFLNCQMLILIILHILQAKAELLCRGWCSCCWCCDQGGGVSNNIILGALALVMADVGSNVF